MTIGKVVDASAAAAVIFDEPERNLIVNRVQQFALHAPFLLQHEIASVCVKKSRRDPANEQLYLFVTQMLATLNVQFHSVDARSVADAAIRHKLTAYDASYLWLAHKLQLELVTLDGRLERAFRAP